jgi:hypothetical protein
LAEAAQSSTSAGVPDRAADSRLAVVETIGAVCWLAMDATWMLGWRAAATLLVVPCLVAHLLLFRFTPRSFIAVVVTGSMTGWLTMNAAWMLGDMWAVGGFLVLAKCLCATASALLIVAFSKSHWRPEAQALFFAGFRRLRVSFHQRPRR